MEKLTNFGEILKDLMEERDLTEADLADKAGLSRSMICMYLKGNTLPAVKSLIKLANYFNCSTDYLLGFVEGRKKYSLSIQDITFIERLNLLLEENKCSVYRMAKECDFSKTLYYDWRKGYMPAAEQLIKIANYFCVSTDYLLGLTDKK